MGSAEASFLDGRLVVVSITYLEENSREEAGLGEDGGVLSTLRKKERMDGQVMIWDQGDWW